MALDSLFANLPDKDAPEASGSSLDRTLASLPDNGPAQPMDQNESVIRQAPPETWFDTAKRKALDFAETFPAMSSDAAQANRNAKSAAALSIADTYRAKGIAVDLGDVEANLDRYTGHKEVRPGVAGLGLRNGLTYDEGVNLGMGALVAVGLGTAPVSTAIGLAGFEALGYFKGNLLEQTRKAYLTGQDLFSAGPGDDLFANRRTFEDGTYRNLRDFLPETASTPLKAIFDAAEFAAMGKTLHAAYGPGKLAAQHAFEVATHDVIREVRGPERVFISPEKIRDIFQTGEKISPEEADLVSSLGLNAQQYRNAFDYGLNIEVPTAKITRMVEKPWWGKVRELFKVDPYEAYTAQTEVLGETRGTVPVAALPEGKGLVAEPGKAPIPGVAETPTAPAPLAPTPAEIAATPLYPVAPSPALDSSQARTAQVKGDGSAMYLPKPEIVQKIGQKYFEGLLQDIDGLGRMPESPRRKEEYDNIRSALEVKGVKYIDAYHLSDTSPGTFRREGVKGSGLDYIGSPSGNVRASSVYVFLDPDDIGAGYGGVLGAKSPSNTIVHIKIPLTRLEDLRWDSNFNVTFETYSSARFLGDVSPDMIAGYASFDAQTMKIRDYSQDRPAAAMVEGGAVTSTAPVSPDMAYLTMQNEAQARALETVQKQRAKDSGTKHANTPVPDYDGDPQSIAIGEFSYVATRLGGLDKTYIEANYPPEIVAVLSAGNMLKKGGAHPEALAQQLGYSDESAMLNTVYGSFSEKLTAEQALRALLEASGEMARYALDSDEYAAFLDEQAKILERLLDGPRTRKAPKILDPGNPTFAELQVDESVALEAALKRAERSSRDAFRAGDIEGALEQKEHQKAIVERARARRAMREELSGIKRELEKASKNTKIPLEYQDRVAAILDSVDIRRGAKTQSRLDSLSDFLDRQEALGEDTSYIPVELIERLQKTPLANYTIEDLRDLRDSVARLVHLGGLKNKLIASRQARDFDETVQDMVVGIFDKASLDAAALAQEQNVPLLGVARPSLFGRLRAPADDWMASTMGPEFIVRALDGFKHEGPVHDAIWNAQKHANDAELLRMEQHREAMDRILAPVIAEGHKFFSKKYAVPGVRGLLTMNQAVSIHLNSQRPVNVDHMVRGNKLKVEEIKAVSEFIPSPYRKMVGEIWDYNESLFPDISRNNEAITGQRLKPTEGRYYPASMDYELTQRGNQQLAAMAAGEKLQESPYIRPGTRASFREAATGGNQPLKLDLSVWVRHLMAESVDTTRTLAARDTSRLLMDPRVKQAITLARGEGEYNNLVAWVKAQRDTGRPRMDAADKLLEGLRGNFTTAQLVLNVGNILQQPFSLLNVTSEPGIGPLDMALGINSYVANPNAAYAFAASRSVEFRDRTSYDTMAGDRELAAMAAKANALDAGLISEAKRLGFYPTIFMDRIATTIAWNIGYRKGMLDFNGDETKAIDYADSLMARTQSSNNKLHRPEIMNAQGWRRFVTMFMTWQMAYTNQFRENVGRLVDQPSAENVLHFTKYVFWALIAQTALTSPFQYGRLPDKKELVKDIATAPVRGIPLLNTLLNPLSRMAIGNYAPPYSASPLERIPQGVVDLGSAMKSNTAGSGTRAWMEALELGSYATGVPVAPVTKAVRAVQEKKKTGKGNVLNIAVPRQRELKK